MEGAHSCRIDILLATHNGATYLPALLQSVADQSHDEWQLIVRDDGSTDTTLEILGHWQKRHPDRIRVITHNETKRGAQANFSALLDLSQAPYFMFCDQDDVWMPNKLALFCETMNDIETRLGSHTPILLYSDLIVVDRDLRHIAESYQRYQRHVSYRAGSNPGHLMLANCVTGCASMGNAALRDIARPIPDDAAMHDWWLALVAANLGALHWIATPTVLYRQHDANEVGAHRSSFVSRMASFLNSPGAMKQLVRVLVSRTQRQAAAFVDRFDGSADPNTVRLFRDYSQLRSRSFVERKFFMVEHGIWPGYWLRAGAMWWVM